MNCKDANRLLGAWRDKELDDQQAREVSQHVQQCAHCRAEYQSLEHMAAVLRAEYQTAVPEGLAARTFHAAINAEPLEVLFLHALFPVAWPTAVATSMAAVGLVAWSLSVGASSRVTSAELFDQAVGVSTTVHVQGVLQGALGVAVDADDLGGDL